MPRYSKPRYKHSRGVQPNVDPKTVGGKKQKIIGVRSRFVEPKTDPDRKFSLPEPDARLEEIMRRGYRRI